MICIVSATPMLASFTEKDRKLSPYFGTESVPLIKLMAPRIPQGSYFQRIGGRPPTRHCVKAHDHYLDSPYAICASFTMCWQKPFAWVPPSLRMDTRHSVKYLRPVCHVSQAPQLCIFGSFMFLSVMFLSWHKSFQLAGMIPMSGLTAVILIARAICALFTMYWQNTVCPGVPPQSLYRY